MNPKHIFLYVLFAMFANATTSAKAQAVNVQDSLALVDLYNSTDGPNWINHANWLAGPVNTWYGITVTDGRVTTINLYYNNLNGIIVASLGNLIHIKSLALNGNQLSGSIPSSLGNLINLSDLSLENNNLSGSIPPELGNLANLRGLYLQFNQLSGSIPPEIGNLVTLVELMLNYNQINKIPKELGNLANLAFLFLSNNQLSGNIPPELGKLTNVNYLNLENNQLSGSIPPELGNMSTLGYLILSNNHLSGSIPPELGNLKGSLSQLYLGNNQLSGSIPPELGNLGLQILALNNNQLSGSIPPELGNPLFFSRLFLSYNHLTGSIPSSLGNLTNLMFLYLDNNQLTGSIPSSFGNLTNLYELNLNNNQLRGHITSAIGNLKNLYYLNLSNNKLSGNISSSITNLPLSLLNISYNHFTFSGMELVAQTFPFATFSNQARIPVHQNGNILSASAGGTLSNNTYGWFRVGGTDTTIITGDSVFYPLQSGTYYVKIINSIAKKLVLKGIPIDYVAPPALENTMTTSSENTLQKDERVNVFTIYPNPAKDILHIQNTGKATFTLTNQSGKNLITKTINGNGAINVSHLPAGLYYLKNNETGAAQKVMIVK